MGRLYGILAAVIAAVIVVIGVAYSTPAVQAQGGRQVEVKRVIMSADQVTTQTLGVPVGISCLERNNGVQCFVVSTR